MVREKLAAYDRATCNSLFKLLWKPAYRAASRQNLRLSHPEIEEAISSAIQESWGKLIHLESSQACCAYVAQVAYRKAVSLLRSKTAEKRGLNQTVSLHQGPSEQNAESSDSSNSSLENVLIFPAERSFEIGDLYKQACSALNEFDRQIVDAFYLEELSYNEISEQMDIPIGSVGTALSRALKVLKKFGYS